MSRFRAGNGRLAAPRGALWIGIVGLVITTAIGLLSVHFTEFTKQSFEFDRWLNSFNSPLAYTVSDILDWIDRPVVVAAILLVGGIIITFWRGWLPAIGFMVVAGVGWLMIAGVKEIVREERPIPFIATTGEHSPSYPSGHTVFVMTLLMAVWAVTYASKWRWPLVAILAVLTLATGLSRLYLGLHYPADVIGGVIGGFSSALLVIGVWNLFFIGRGGRYSAR
jgi:membrane-associated phospholipid phosphatase